MTKYLTKDKLMDAYYIMYDLKQSDIPDLSDRMELRKAMTVLHKYREDPRIPEKEAAHAREAEDGQVRHF